MYQVIKEIQAAILERIRQSLERGEGLSIRELGTALDLSPTTVLYHIKQLENLGFIVRNSAGKVVRVNSADDSSAIAFLPLVGSARCGRPLSEVIDENTVRMIPIPLRVLGRNSKKSLFLIQAVGDSMEPKIENGDIVIFEENRSPDPGSIIVARTDEGTTIKRLRKTQEQIVLEPDNNMYQPLVFEKNGIEEKLNIDGTAIGVFKSETNLMG